MNNSLRPKINTRDTQKCSACRQRKKKCSPHNRDWENSQQKCDYCETRDLSCGPNLRYSVDRAVRRRAAVVPEDENVVESNPATEQPRGHPDGSATSSGANVAAPATCRTQGRNDGPPNPNGEDGRQPFGASSVKDLEEKARSKLQDFNALVNTLAYVSQPAFAYCRAHGAQQPYDELSMEEKLHELFINIHGLAVEANDLNEPHMARWVLFALVSALDQYPRLFDSRKRHILLKIALMFQELGHHWKCEYVLLKIAGVYKGQGLSSSEEHFHRLATSFSTSSKSRRRVLVDRWNETIGGNDIDSNLNVPPLHAAVQHGHSSVIVTLLSKPDDYMVNIDERDLNGWTALFAAVANGDESCSLVLLMNGANADTRDGLGHTALEMAVRGGNLNIVKNLIQFNANVNPNIAGCSSLPLHAAIESENFQLEIISHLLNSGAEVYLQRYADNKNAIDLANDRGYHELAKNMGHMFPNLEQTPFMLHDHSMGQIVS